MNTIENVFNIMDGFSTQFKRNFKFYTKSFNEIMEIQGAIGLTEKEMANLTPIDDKLVKSYLFLAESSNTTSVGALRLISSNLFSDAYSLMRILYEITCLMHWGNISIENKQEVYDIIFKSRQSGTEQGKLEWKLIQKAQTQFETEKPGLIDIRKKLNNYGSHISREKIVGNITSLNGASASTMFVDNSGNSHYLMGLEFTHLLYNMILEEYAIHLKHYSGATDKDISLIGANTNGILQNIRPSLQKMVKNN